MSLSSLLGCNDVAMTERYANLATQLDITNSDLANNWEAFSLSHDDADHTDANFALFRTFVQSITKKNGPKEDRKRPAQVMGSPSPNPNVKAAKTESNVTATMVGSSNTARISTSPGPGYEDRKNAGQIVAHLNVNLPEKAVLKDGDIGFTSLTPVKIGGSDFKCNVDKKYRYMFTTLPERARALDQRLTKMAGEMEERYGMENVSAVGVPCTEEVQVVGRICNEAHEGRINKTSVVLEGDRGNAGGARIELGLEALKTYSVFPGQIVGVQGLNPSGRKMVAKKICEGVPKPMAKSKAGELMKLQYDDRNGQPLSVFAASGPFTTSGDLDYAPLVDLLAIASRLQPDAVILTGPFVDVNHPLCKDGEVNFEDVDGNKVPVTYETVFQDRVARTIEDFFDDGQACPTQFILVPSLEDAFHDNVYPQPPFADRIQGGVVMDIPGGEGIKVGTLGIEDVEEVVKQKQPQTHKRVHCVSNPATFKINDVVFGVTSVDPILALNTNQASVNINRMERMAQHLIQQQSYYPIFPAPKSAANLDLRHLDKFSMEVTPDVLILPSKLAPFAKDVMGSVVINPTTLAKGNTGGSYASITVHPMKREELEGDGDIEMEHKVKERARVVVQKI